MLRSVKQIILLLFAITMMTISYADTDFVKRHEVQLFIHQMVKKHKFDKQQLTTLFAEVKPLPEVIRHINKPLEKQPWSTYQMLFVNEWRIEHGVKFWDQFEEALTRAEKMTLRGFKPDASIALFQLPKRSSYSLYILNSLFIGILPFSVSFS